MADIIAEFIGQRIVETEVKEVDRLTITNETEYICFNSPTPLSCSAHKRIEARLGKLFPKQKIIILEDGCTITPIDHEIN